MESDVLTSTSTLVGAATGSIWDIFLLCGVLLIALLYLFLKLWVKRGSCSDCASGGGACASCQPDKFKFDISPRQKRQTSGEDD